VHAVHTLLDDRIHGREICTPRASKTTTHARVRHAHTQHAHIHGQHTRCGRRIAHNTARVVTSAQMHTTHAQAESADYVLQRVIIYHIIT